MILELNEQQKLLQRAAKEFVGREIAPIADEYDKKYRPLPRDVAVDLLKKLVPLGYIGARVPPEYGGHGLDFISFGILLEELAKAYASLAFMVSVQNGTVLLPLVKEGTEEQKQKYIPEILSLNKISGLACTEPDVGSGIRDIKATAVLKRDRYYLNGTKVWISHGTIADILTVFALTENGITCFLVEKAESPFRTRELAHLGLRSCPTCEICFEDCPVPRENVLGGLGEGLRIASEDFLEARIHMGAIATGIAQAAFEASVNYARQRKQFGRPIGTLQLVQGMITDMAIAIESARFLYRHAGYLLDKGEKCFKESSMAKAFATEMAILVTSKSIEIHGAYGISEDYPLERYFRDARTLTFPDGTPEIQKLIAGREILGLSAFT